ncbi:MAG: hypothetical protein ACLR6B_13125 [Blautia sp.]
MRIIRSVRQTHRYEAANGQTAAANATIANAAAALSALQGQADENGMISARKSQRSDRLSCSGRCRCRWCRWNQCRQLIPVRHRRLSGAVADQLCFRTGILNDTASQLNQAAAGLDSGAGTLKSKSSDMSNGASQMSAGAKQMEAGVSSIPEVPSDPINTVTAAVDQLYAGAQKVNAGSRKQYLPRLYTLEDRNKRLSEGSSRCESTEHRF